MDLLFTVVSSTLVGAVAVAFVWSGVWGYRDAEKSG
jgi:hypothetical protein